MCGPFLLLFTFEAVLRLAKGTPPAENLPANFEYGHVEIHQPFFKEQKDSTSGKLRYVNNRSRSQKAEFLMPKPKGMFRIFVLGGSVVLPFSEPGTKLAEFLEILLPERTFEVISLGMGAYDSRRVAMLFPEVLGFEPDLLIVLSGNNEYYGQIIRRPRLYLWRHRFRSFWLFRMMDDAYRRAAPGNTGKTDLSAELLIPNYESNLRRMSGLAREAQVPLLFSTIPTNLRDSTPQDPYIFPIDDEVFFSGWTSWAAGNCEEGGASFQDYLSRHPKNQFGLFYYAKCLERLGRREEASQYYAQAASLDVPGDRSSPVRNKSVRKVSREGGDMLADLEMTFSKASPAGIPGREMFKDSCHFFPEYYPLASHAIIRSIFASETKDNPVIAEPARWRWERLKGVEPQLAHPHILNLFFSDSLFRGMFKSLEMGDEYVDQGAVNLFGRVLELQPELLRGLISSKHHMRGLLASDWSAHLRGQEDLVWDRVLVHAGEAFRRHGDFDNALACFTQAKALAPQQFRPRLGRAITLAQMNRRSQSRDEFKNILIGSIDRIQHRAEVRNWRGYFFSQPSELTLPTARVE